MIIHVLSCRQVFGNLDMGWHQKLDSFVKKCEKKAHGAPVRLGWLHNVLQIQLTASFDWGGMEMWLYGESPSTSGQTGGGLLTAGPTITRHNMVNYLGFLDWICHNVSAQPERSGSNVAELSAGGARVSRAKWSIIVGLSQLDDRWGLMKWVSFASYTMVIISQILIYGRLISELSRWINHSPSNR